MIRVARSILVFIVAAGATGCTPASMPVSVQAVAFEMETLNHRALTVRVDETSLEKAQDVIGNPKVLGYPIDARSAVRESVRLAAQRAFPNASIGSGDRYPQVTVFVEDFDVDREIEGDITSRFTAEAVLTLRVDIVQAAGAVSSSTTFTARKNASKSGIADSVERNFGKVIDEAVQGALRDVVSAAIADVARRIR